MSQPDILPRSVLTNVDRYNCIKKGIRCRFLIAKDHKQAKCAFGHAASGEILIEKLTEKNSGTLEPGQIESCVNKITTVDEAVRVARAILAKYSN